MRHNRDRTEIINRALPAKAPQLAALVAVVLAVSCGSAESPSAGPAEEGDGPEPLASDDVPDPLAADDGPEPAPDDDAELADGWTLAEGTGYRVGLPPGWLDAHQALEDEDFVADLAEQIDSDELADMLKDNVENLDLLAIRAADLTSEFVTSVNIFTGERGPLDEPEFVLERAAEIVASFGAELTGTDEYTVSDLPAVEITYDLPRPDVDVAGIQSYVFGDDVVFVATYTAVEPDPGLWHSILGTFSTG